MKAMLVLLVAMATAFTAPRDFKEFAPVAEKIEKKYLKLQSEYTKQNTKFSYEFSSVDMFPAFCQNTDTLSKFLATRPRSVHVADVTIGVYEEQGARHVLMSVLSFTGASKVPRAKIYTLFFMKQDPATKEWVEDRNPVEVTLNLADREAETYECKKIAAK